MGSATAWVAAALLLAGCAPTLDWREVRPSDSGAVAMFPCKPRAQTRDVVAHGVSLRLTLVACEAGGSTYALSFAQVTDPTQVSPALEALRASSIGNARAEVRSEAALNVPGMTPNTHARRLHLAARAADGVGREIDAAFFAIGTRVFQATIVAAAADPAAVEAFFTGLRAQS